MPLDTASDNFLARTAYGEEGGWQQVTILFQAPGSVGSGEVPVAFTMGIYDTTEVPYINNPTAEYDGDTGTVDDRVAAGYAAGGGLPWNEQSRYFIDGFSITQVPEPSSVVLFGFASLLGLVHRRRA